MSAFSTVGVDADGQVVLRRANSSEASSSHSSKSVRPV